MKIKVVNRQAFSMSANTGTAAPRDELRNAMELCADALRFTAEKETLPFRGKALSKGVNFEISKSWHSTEAFLSLGPVGARIVKNLEEAMERIDQSELPDGPKKVAIELVKLYALLKADQQEYHRSQSFVVNICKSSIFGEVISFQIKNNRLYAALDCMGHLYRFFHAMEEVRKKREEEQKRKAATAQ